MKVLFLSKRVWPEIGGVEKHIYEIEKRLKERGYKIIVVSEKNIEYPKIKLLGLFWIWVWLLKNRKIFKEADLIHIHDVVVWYLPLRFILLKKPVYATFHGWEGKFPIPAKNKIIRRISEKLSWDTIDIGDYLSKWYGTKPTFVTYGGAEINNYHTTVRDSYQREVLFVGRLEEDTGLSIYLEALRSITSKNLKVAFAGDGPLKEEAEKFGEILGFVKKPQKFIANSKFIFTSGYLSMLEAMAAKRLVFAVYDNPLKRDYLKLSPFAKYAVIESSAKKLAEKVEYYLKNPGEEERRVEESYNWARKQTWDKAVDLYLKLWRIKV